MNHYEPLQRKPDGRWDYTRRNDDDVQAVGYCRPFVAWSKETAATFGVPFGSNWMAKAASFAHKHHSTGHDTAQEAAECYAEYLLDHSAQYLCSYVNEQRPCLYCKKYSEFYATVKQETFDLCLEHNNSIYLRSYFEPPMEMVSSY